MAFINIHIDDIGKINKKIYGIYHQLNEKLRNKIFKTAIRSVFKDIKPDILTTTKKRYTANRPRGVKTKVKVFNTNGRLNFTGPRGYSLIKFKAQPSRITKKRPPAGVSTQIKRGGPRYVRQTSGYSKPFIATLGGQKKLVMRKEGTRKKLDVQLGPALMDYIKSKENAKIMEREVHKMFPKAFENAFFSALGNIK